MRKNIFIILLLAASSVIADSKIKDPFGKRHYLDCYAGAIMSSVRTCEIKIELEFDKNLSSFIVPRDKAITNCNDYPANGIFINVGNVEVKPFALSKDQKGLYYRYTIDITLRNSSSNGAKMRQDYKDTKSFYYEPGFKWPYTFPQSLYTSDEVRNNIMRYSGIEEPEYMMKGTDFFYKVITTKLNLYNSPSASYTCRLGFISDEF